MLFGHGFNRPFDLLSLSPLMWFDAGDGAQFLISGSTYRAAVQGESVARWLDKSGNNRHATQTNSSDRGIFNDGAIVPNSNDSLGYSTGFAINKPYTIFVAENPILSRGASRTINSWDINGLISSARNDGYPCYANATISSFVATANETHVAELVAPATGNFIYLLDGIDKTQSQVTSANWGRLGIGNAGQNYEQPYTRINEIIVLPLSDAATRQKVRDYLNARWK